MEMEYDRAQHQQRIRLGVLLIGGILLVGAFFFWGEPEEPKEETAPAQAPPSQSVEAPVQAETPKTVPAPPAPPTPAAEPPTVPPAATSLPGTAQTPSAPASPEAEILAEEGGGTAAEREDAESEQPKEEISSLPPPTGVIRASRLNVRRQPNLAAERIDMLSRGAQVTILDEEGSWYHIQAEGGALEGWVAKRYVDTATAQATSPSS